MALYESEYTVFWREMMKKHPEWSEDRLVGRSILWDRKVDLGEQKTLSEASEAGRAYPYDVNFEHK